MFYFIFILLVILRREKDDYAHVIKRVDSTSQTIHDADPMSTVRRIRDLTWRTSNVGGKSRVWGPGPRYVAREREGALNSRTYHDIFNATSQRADLYFLFWNKSLFDIIIF